MSKTIEAIQRSQYSIARVLLSLYLMYFFISLIEQRQLIESLLGTANALQSATLLVPLLALVFCILLFLGIFVSYASLALLLFYQMGFIFLPIPKEVQASYISIILLVFVFFTKKNIGPRFLNTQLTNNFSWNLFLFFAVYFGFTISGLSKIFYPAWLNGEAVEYFCTTSQIGNLAGTFTCAILPKTLIGYIVLFAEIASFPLAIFSKTRPIAWLLNTGLHLFIPIFIYVWPVSFGVLLMQIMLFDSRWFTQSNPFILFKKEKALI